jgi:methionyl-tRNA formyltransferase
VKIVFFGTPGFAASILEHLVLQSPHQEVIAVISKPDARKGRGQQVMQTPVHVMAERLLPTIPILQPKKTSDISIVEFLRSLQADVFVVVAYGEIVKKAILEIPRLGCLNIHASILPHLRGAAPIQRAIMQGDRKTGITIMRMDEGLDTGDMLLQKEVPIFENDTFPDIEAGLLSLAKESIVEALDLITKEKAFYVPQENALATFAPKICEKDLHLCPQEEVRKLHNLVRTFSPKPGAYFTILVRGKECRLKVLSSLKMEESNVTDFPVLRKVGSTLALVNSSGILLLKTIQLEGKAPVDSESFLRGYPIDCLSLYQSA